MSVQCLMHEPNPDDPLRMEIAQEWRTDRRRYMERARAFTRQHAIRDTGAAPVTASQAPDPHVRAERDGRGKEVSRGKENCRAQGPANLATLPTSHPEPTELVVNAAPVTTSTTAPILMPKDHGASATATNALAKGDGGPGDPAPASPGNPTTPTTTTFARKMSSISMRLSKKHRTTKQ
jgi:hypothetical protein